MRTKMEVKLSLFVDDTTVHLKEPKRFTANYQHEDLN